MSTYEEFFTEDERTILAGMKERNHAAYKERRIPSRADLMSEEKRALNKEIAFYGLKSKEAWEGMDLRESEDPEKWFS